MRAKWSADQLLQGVEHVSVLTGARAQRIDISGSRAAGVHVRQGFEGGFLKADAVVVAAGGLGTPALLQRSGIKVENRLFDDPVICMAARMPGAGMDRQIPMPFGSQQEGYILSPYLDLLSFFFNKEWRRAPADVVSLMVKYCDIGEGSYDGKTLSLPQTHADKELVAESLKKCSAILADLGIRPEDTFVGTLNAGHPGGMLPLNADSAQTLRDARLPQNVYVADSSLFPQSMGNPPILTIMALAKKVAARCTEACA